MYSKKFQVVGISHIKTDSKCFKVVHCLGDPFFDSHVGQFTCVCFVGIDSNISVGDIVDVIRAGKNYYIVSCL